MIEDFLRPATHTAQHLADALRLLGVLSVVVALALYEVTDAAIIAFVLPGLMLPRFLGVRAWADITVSLTLLVAAWSNVYDLYTTIGWWDLPVHFVCNAVVAAMAYLFLGRLAVVPLPGEPGFTRAGAVVLTTAFGLAAAALWEMVEWLGHTYITDDIFITLGDTIGDMAVGGLGAVCAGVVLAVLPLLRRDVAARVVSDRSGRVGA